MRHKIFSKLMMLFLRKENNKAMNKSYQKKILKLNLRCQWLKVRKVMIRTITGWHLPKKIPIQLCKRTLFTASPKKLLILLRKIYSLVI